MTVSKNPVELIKPLALSVAYSQPPHDSNDIYQIRSLIRSHESHTFYVHDGSVFLQYIQSMENVKVDNDRSNFPRRDYNSYMNTLLEMYRGGNHFASSMRRFLHAFIGGKEITENEFQHNVSVFSRNMDSDSVEVLDIAKELVLGYHTYTLGENKGIESIILSLVEAIDDFVEGKIRHEVLAYLRHQSMLIVEDVPYKIDEFSILLILIISDIVGADDVTLSKIKKTVDVSLRDMKDHGNANLYLSGIYDNPLIVESTILNDALMENVRDSRVELRELQLGMGLRKSDTNPFRQIGDMGGQYESLDELQNNFHPGAAKRFNLTHTLDNRDLLVLSEGLRKSYRLYEGKDINGNPVYYAQDGDGIMVITKNVSDKEEYKLLQIVDYIDDSIYKGFIDPKLLDDKKIKTRDIRLKGKVRDMSIVKETAISFTEDGDVSFKPRRNLMDEFTSLNRLVNIHIRRGETDQLKPVLVELFSLINYVEGKYIGKSEPLLSYNRRKKEVAMKARMYTISTFNRAYGYVLDEDSSFDFSKYFIENQTERVTHKLTYNELLGIRKVLSGILTGI